MRAMLATTEWLIRISPRLGWVSLMVGILSVGFRFFMMVNDDVDVDY